LAALAAAETGLGNAGDLAALHRTRVLGTLGDLRAVRTTGIIDERPAEGLTLVARPAGVVTAVTPATAPVSGVICQALQLLKARNVTVVAPHPRAARSAAAAVELVRQGLQSVGAPQDAVQGLPIRDRTMTGYAMAAADLVIAVGGAGTVSRAHSSGRPAMGAAQGNATVVVDETADVAAAARLIVHGASFNHGTSCSSESNVLVAAERAEAFLSEVRAAGGVVCTPEQALRLQKVLWPDGRTLARDLLGRPPTELAARADIPVPARTKALVLSGDLPDGHVALMGKLLPLLTVLVYDRFEAAVRRVARILTASGAGHSCAIHTAEPGRALRLAETVPAVRVLVNQSTAVGNSGSFDNGLPFSSALAGGTWGGTGVSGNITWSELINRVWVSRPVAGSRPESSAVLAAPEARTLGSPVPLEDRGVSRGPGDLESNESPRPASTTTISAVIAALADAHRYPETSAATLRAAVGDLLGVEAQQVIVGHGSEDVLRMLIATAAARGRVLMGEPACTVHTRICRAVGAAIVTRPLRDHRHDLDALAAVDADVALLCNPHNPTGTALLRAEVERFIAQRRARLVVVDEAYVDFADDPDALSCVPLATQREDVVVVRTLSKAYSLAGLRIGYLIGGAGLTNSLRDVAPPFAVSGPAAAGAIAALADRRHWDLVRADNRIMRDRLSTLLGTAGHDVVPSQANFVFVPPGGPQGLADRLAAGGIRVRRGEQLEVPGSTRITVPGPEGLRMVAAALGVTAQAWSQ
jgi:sulfoacetaldehyde dehydrogenase